MKIKEYLHSIVTDEKMDGFFVLILKIILLLLSYIYWLVISCINFRYWVDRYLWSPVILSNSAWYKRIKLPKPVISVGNLTWGGVGKTPIVEFIVKGLMEKGYKPVILTRGYMGRKGKGKNSNVKATSDEAQMLKNSIGDVPILVGYDRAFNAREYIKNGGEVDFFILDDGFQHRSIFRDLDILAIDSTNPFGNKYLIPRGILREPVSSIKRADMVVLTKYLLDSKSGDDVFNYISKKYPTKQIIKTNHQPESLINLISHQNEDLGFLEGKKVCCFCAIGNPDSFKMNLQTLRADVEKSFFFMDHHAYESIDINNIINYCINNNIYNIITTSKDSVKLEHLEFYLPKNIKIYILKIDLNIIKGKEQFFERISSLLSN